MVFKFFHLYLIDNLKEENSIMKKLDPFSFLLVSIWSIGTLIKLPDLLELNRGPELILNIAAVMLILIILIICAIGINYRKCWARTLYLYVSIIVIFLILFVTIYSLQKQQVLDATLLGYSLLIFSPWIGILLYGIYYLNRKDIRESFGLSKDNKSKN